MTPAINDVIAGHIPVAIVGLAGSLAQINAGLLRALAMTGPNRAVELPNVPTLAEKGIAGFPAEPWSAFFAPAATPAPVLVKLAGGPGRGVEGPRRARKAQTRSNDRNQHARGVAQQAGA